VLCSRFLPFIATTPRVEHRGTVTCSLLLSFLLFLSQPQLHHVSNIEAQSPA
ncbi:unnamed protein product, partial [Musa banksii]